MQVTDVVRGRLQCTYSVLLTVIQKDYGFEMFNLSIPFANHQTG